ncbi:MAG: tetratricopeptide repeat protein [Paracoccaceae bacterium]
MAAAPPAPPPGDPVEIGKRLLAENQPELALSAFNRGIASASSAEARAVALTGAGVALLKLGRGGEARRLLEAALTLDPELVTAHNALGVAHHDARRHAAAAASFRRASELSGGDDPAIRANLGMAEAALADDAANVPKLDEFDYDVIQYGHGVYRLTPRAARPAKESRP